MKLLVAGEDGPGALLRSLVPGLSRHAYVVVTDPAGGSSGLIDSSSPLAGVRRRLGGRGVDGRFLAAVAAERPDAVLVVKGRHLSGTAVNRAQAMGAAVVVLYPDNPFWRTGDRRGAAGRLQAADVVVIWSQRLAASLEPVARRVEVVPFGYDDRWFEPGTGERHGVAFLGTWSRRRDRFLAALAGLPLAVYGTGWRERSRIPAGAPTYEAAAGQVLGGAAIGVNLLHPQCAGAHNMRTREIAAAGALQLTDVGTDGTPLRDGHSCVWFRAPEELRARVEWFLSHPEAARTIASRGRALVRSDSYTERADQLIDIVKSAIPTAARRPAYSGR